MGKLGRLSDILCSSSVIKKINCKLKYRNYQEKSVELKVVGCFFCFLFFAHEGWNDCYGKLTFSELKNPNLIEDLPEICTLRNSHFHHWDPRKWMRKWFRIYVSKIQPIRCQSWLAGKKWRYCQRIKCYQDSYKDSKFSQCSSFSALIQGWCKLHYVWSCINMSHKLQ